MRILVVGGAGYIGSHICKSLAQLGFIPVTYDNLSTGHLWAVQWGPFVHGDLKDTATLRQAFDDYHPSAVVHLASLINVRDSIVNPTLYYEKNLFETLSLLKTMIEKGVLNLIYSSTAAIYGTPQYIPIDELHPKTPMNAYGKTKWAVEGMLEDFSHAYNLRFVALRYFNACGADLEGLIGEAHEPETHLIPLAIRAALGQLPSLQVYGDDYPTPDGTAIRDYIHVLDLAEAHVKALHYLLEHRASFQCNLGTGVGYSVKQIIEKVKSFSREDFQVVLRPRFAQDSPVLVADPTRAKKILQWEPKYSDLSTVISTAWNWEQTRLNWKENELFPTKQTT